jgi:riboflavin kinase / FMN adenylyltransferase
MKIEVIRGIHNLKKRHEGCVVTIGNFDGVHLGHQKLLKKLIRIGKHLHLPTLVIIFEPQPHEYFSPTKKVPRLMRFREKVERLDEQGIDRVLCLHFDETIAMQAAERFVSVILFEKLLAKYVLVGDDFRFGFRRLGDYALLKQEGKQYHFKTGCMQTCAMKGERISSTSIRKILESGNMEKANMLLGRPFTLKGKIIHGDKRGRQIGYPTANIDLHRKAVPISGIFVVTLLGVTPSPLQGVASVGTRPTISDDNDVSLEVHLLNFAQDIYGKRVEVQFIHKLREEERFASLTELKDQIKKDVDHVVENAQDYFVHVPR